MIIFNHSFKNIINKDFSILNTILLECIIRNTPIKNDKFKNHCEYSDDLYIMCILDVLKNYHSWNSYNGPIPGNTLRLKHKYWIKYGVYDNSFKIFLDRYLNNVPITNELKYQSIDSTFIIDVNGSKFSSFNGTYKCGKGKSCRGIKVTSITTTNEISISVNINSGKDYDSKILHESI